MVSLILVRGLPGSGKTTFAREVADAVYSADDHFTVGGVYTFDPTLLPAAHELCRRNVRESLVLALGGASHRKRVAVANTFSRTWEMEKFVAMAKELGVRLFIVDLFDAGMSDAELAARCVHAVPERAIAVQRARWEH